MERRGTKGLELWARRATSGYEGVNVTNMTTAWRNGLAFCALIHHYRPDLIDFSSLKPENILENNALAFSVAEQQLGIPALLDAEDMEENEIPDRLSVLTYVSQYYQAFASMGLLKQGGGNAATKAVQSKPVESPGSKRSPPPQPSAKKEMKADKIWIGGRGRREVCVGCSNPVFLAQRILVGSPGQLMHRTCFRCARCTAQLTLASYYETEKGQFCCETCPDEERNASPDGDITSINSSTSSKNKQCSSSSDTETDSDSESEHVVKESDSYSSNVESLLEDRTLYTDTQSNTLPKSPAVSPKPLKPRTVFLTQTLEAATDEDTNSSRHVDVSEAKVESSYFSQVSPALCGPRVEGSQDAAALVVGSKGGSCSAGAEGLKAEPPPDTVALDTGQERKTNNVFNSRIRTSSIVAERLRIFKEISENSSKRSGISQKDLFYGKRGKEISNRNKEESQSIVDDVDSDKSSKTLSSNDYVPRNETDARAIEGEMDITMNVTQSINSEKESDDPVSRTENDRPVSVKDSLEPEPVSEHSVPEKESPEPVSITQNSVTHVESDEPEASTGGSVPGSGKELPEPAFILESEKTENEQTDQAVSSVPAITVTTDKQGIDTLEEKLPSDTDTVPETVSKESPSQDRHLQEYNPFDDEDDSQPEDSGLASGSQCEEEGGHVADNNSPHLHTSQDSGADVLSLSSRSIQYPDDLNPFGSCDESPSEGAVPDKADTTSVPVPQDKEDQTPTKRLIKVKLNPFDSDEDDDMEKEVNKGKDKITETKNMNPFWSDEEPSVDSVESTPTKKYKPPRPPPPTLARNSTPSQMYPSVAKGIESSPKTQVGSATRRKIIAPPPPTNMQELFPPTSPQSTGSGDPHSSPSLSVGRSHPSPSSPHGSLALRRKGRRAPAPPELSTGKSGRASPADNTGDNLSLSSVGTQSQEDGRDEVLNWKMQKDMKNHSNKMNSNSEHNVPPPKPSRTFQVSKNVTGITRRPSMSKSEAGEWQRKKGPAPPRPVPQKRAIKKLPMRIVQQELQDIEIKQTELERQGVLLETTIRNQTENTSSNSGEDDSIPSSGPNSIEVEDMILQLFELVNEKNELFRRQTELMYMKREKRLEEEYVELEYQIRCLMLKLPSEKTKADIAQEEELIARLVKVVEQRDEIINCLELDRLREAQEDESIATHMMQYQEKHIDGVENGNSVQETPKKKKALKIPKKKKKKEKKDKKGSSKTDADKDIDETEVEVKKKKKKKWLF